MSWLNEWKPEFKAEGNSRCVYEIEPTGASVKLTLTQVRRSRVGGLADGHIESQVAARNGGYCSRLPSPARRLMANLPATRIEVYVPNAWDDVGKGCGLFDDCWPPNKFLLKGAGTLEPDIRAANDWASYREGRDLIVDAILSDIANPATGRR